MSCCSFSNLSGSLKKMWHFHLSRYWFDKIKNGSKKIEYRFLTERLQKQTSRLPSTGLSDQIIS